MSIDPAEVGYDDPISFCIPPKMDKKISEFRRLASKLDCLSEDIDRDLEAYAETRAMLKINIERGIFGKIKIRSDIRVPYMVLQIMEELAKRVQIEEAQSE